MKSMLRVIGWIGLFVSLSNWSSGQKLQFGYRMLSTDFDQSIGFRPFDQTHFPSGVGIHFLSPYTNFFMVGGDIRVAKINNAQTELIAEQDGRMVFNLSAIARLQRVQRGYWFKPFIQAGVGLQNTRPESRWNSTIQLGLGLDLELSESIMLGISSSFTRELVRNRYFMDYSIGVTIPINEKRSAEKELLETLTEIDRDRDGVPDDRDDCPLEMGTISTSGCPDSDSDGIADIYDACPLEPGLVGHNGCPILETDIVDEGIDFGPNQDSLGQDIAVVLNPNPNITDSDGDGIPDTEDKCPEDYGNPDLNGCPKPDTDNDGISDDKDECPDVFGSIFNAGCPEVDVREADKGIDFRGVKDTSMVSSDPPVVMLMDTDSDGVPDDEDDCPKLAGTKSNSGCPEVDVREVDKGIDFRGVKDTSVVSSDPPVVMLMDTDSDGVPDDEDDCPKLAGTKSNSGCPEVDVREADKGIDFRGVKGTSMVSSDPPVVILMDTDGDGVPNDKDACPELAGAKSNAGCPELDEKEVDKGIDNRGVNDTSLDPSTREKVILREPLNDRDNDGIADRIDPCPDLAGTLENKGCPDSIKRENTASSAVTSTQQNMDKEVGASFEFAPMIHFASGLAVLQREYLDELQEIADFMNANPEYSLKIYGHTDSQGSGFTNSLLSEKRAKACYTFLNLAGKVPKDRMSYFGQGEDVPISDNSTARGRYRNRRVVFDFIRR